MALGLLGVVVRPLHEVEAVWKGDERYPRPIGGLVTMPCLCGGIIAARDRDAAIAYAVGNHNAGTTHRAWAIANGWRQG